MKKTFLALLVVISPIFGTSHAGDLLSEIETKLKAGDFPTGLTSPEYKADKKPHLLELVEEASEDKNERFIPVMKQIAANKKIFWEIRQDAIRYLTSFSSRKDVKQLLKQYSNDKNEPMEIREAAKSGL